MPQGCSPRMQGWDVLPLRRFESVAQLVEHRPFKALVLGSSPSALTISHIAFGALGRRGRGGYARRDAWDRANL